MCLSRTVSEIDGDFSRKSQNFPHPLYFAPPLKRFPLELGVGAEEGGQKWWGYPADKEVWRYLQPSGHNTLMWRTDGRTDSGRRKDRVYTYWVVQLKWSQLTFLFVKFEWIDKNSMIFGECDNSSLTHLGKHKNFILFVRWRHKG